MNELNKYFTCITRISTNINGANIIISHKSIISGQNTTPSPMDQFEINDLIINNINLAGIILIVLVIIILFNNLNNNILFDFSWLNIHDLLMGSTGLRGKLFLVWFYTTFIFILFGNLIGNLPYSYTITASLGVSITISIIVLISNTIINIVRNKLLALQILSPEGTNLLFLPLFIVVETLSYLSRGISLGLRLSANMVSGHSLMYLWSQVVIRSFIEFILFVLLPLVLLIVLIITELGIGVLQAIIFVKLMLTYLTESLS